MQGKIAFEEHTAIEETVEETRSFAGDSGHFDEFTLELLDVEETRLNYMDKTGIEFALLSLNAPGIQGVLDTGEAIELSQKANEKMAHAVAKHPDRYGALAALPMQDPEAAATELKRCVNEMGFKGAMVNGFTQKDTPDSAIYYDIPEYRVFWATVSELGVPFYLHPRMQIKARAQNYEGHPWLMSAPWGFAIETSIHSLRMCGSGMFEDFPDLKIIIGHLGEHIPYDLWRIDARMRFSRRGYRGERPLGEYFLQNFEITTSGNFCDPTLKCAIEVMGTDKIHFSADYPFERMEDAADWWDNTKAISDADKQKMGRDNAIRLFNLNLK